MFGVLDFVEFFYRNKIVLFWEIVDGDGQDGGVLFPLE